MPASLESLLRENRRLFRAVAAAADAALAPLGIQAGDRALLEFLARETAPISISELARKRAVSRQHIHQSLNHLPNPRWIEKPADPADARSVCLQMSEDGRGFWKEIRAVDQALLRRISRRIGDSGIEPASKTLRRI